MLYFFKQAQAGVVKKRLCSYLGLPSFFKSSSFLVLFSFLGLLISLHFWSGPNLCDQLNFCSSLHFWRYTYFWGYPNIWGHPNHLGLFPFLGHLHFSNGPNNVGRWQRATFIFFFFPLLQGTSIGLVRTNHALLSLVDTNFVQYTCTCTSHWWSCAVYIQGLNWVMPHSDFVAWLSSNTLNIFISGFSTRI